MANVINLPTFEQVEQIRGTVESTNGVILGTDGFKYKANFDDVYNTVSFKDKGKMETFVRSFNEKFNTEGSTLNPETQGFYFLYLSDKYRLSFGVTNINGTNKFWYLITDAETFEVVGGRVVLDVANYIITTYGSLAMTDYTMTQDGRYLFIRVSRNGSATLAIIDMNTFEFIKYLPFGPNWTSQLVSLSVTNDYVLGALFSNDNTFYTIPLDVDSNGVPINAQPYSLWSLNIGGTAGQQSASLFADGEFFYASSTPSGGQCRNVKIKFNRVTKAFTELANYTATGTPNPIPPVVVRYIKTLDDGTRVLVRYHSNGNAGYLSVTNLDTFTSIYSVAMGTLGYPMFDGDKVYYGGSVTTNAIKIGDSYYIPFYSYSIRSDTGTPLSETFYNLADPPSAIGGNPTYRGLPQATGIANSKGIFMSPTSSRKLFDMVRVYNLINYSREV